MADLILELFSEEIPARMQARAAAELERRVREQLTTAELEHTALRCDVTPRRLALQVRGLPLSQPDTESERKGPRVGAPDKAMQGFLASVGLRLDEVEIRATPKGEFYFAVIKRQGRATAEVLAESLSTVIAELSWPKSMRWVRPLHAIVCVFDGEVVPVRYGSITAGRTTHGHRFLAPDPIEVASLDDYLEKLAESKVTLDAATRRERVHSDALALATAAGLTLIEDDALLDEVIGLVEYPVVLLGAIDDAYMSVPREILTTTMRSHQKYFSLADANGAMAPHFIVVSNMETADRGAKIRAGNERVLRARLSDAKFFWDSDRERSLECRLPQLDTIVYQAKLGEGADRLSHKVTRTRTLVRELAAAVDADPDAAERVAELAKCDLVSEVVGEFPELQGLMGHYYAKHDGESDAIAHAIAEHYSPQGPSDACPRTPLSMAIALADKIDTLVGFFAIDERPTGSKDPFALRRSALGVLRIVLENRVRLPLTKAFTTSLLTYPEHLCKDAALADELLEFFADRLKVYLRDQGVRHDRVSAVFSAKRDDDLVRLVDKVKALETFLAGEDGANLLAAYRRASKIVAIEEKKDDCRYDDEPTAEQLHEDAERELFERLESASRAIRGAIDAEQFESAMVALATLRAPVDRFFDDVTVNADDANLRRNRLRILAKIRAALGSVADFSQIEG